MNYLVICAVVLITGILAVPYTETRLRIQACNAQCIKITDPRGLTSPPANVMKVDDKNICFCGTNANFTFEW